jgi:flagellar M-ring protein FliF
MAEITPLRALVQRWQIPLIAGGVVLIATLMIAAYFLWFRQPYAVLFSDLRTADAATIVADLDKRKTPYRLTEGGRTILVPQKLVDTTRLSVMGEELPLKGVVGFELFSKSDMGLTEFAQRINYRRALQGEIARTIMALDEVETARVHLSLSEPTVFREDRRPSKASITIIPRTGRQLSPYSVRGIQRLVAAAVSDLEPADVVILDESGGVISRSEGAADPSTLSPAIQEKAAIEGYYAGRVRQAIRGLVPQDQVRVVVTAGAVTPAPPGGDVFADWAPSTRRFPLNLTLSTTAPIGADVQAAVRVAAAQAVGARPQAGDTIFFSDIPAAAPVEAEPSPPAREISLAPESQTARPSARHVTSAATQFWLELSLAVVVVLGASAFLLRRMRSRAKRLTSRERDVFAARLRNLLGEEGEVDALARR